MEVLLSEIAARETLVTAQVGVGNVRRSSRNAALIAGWFGNPRISSSDPGEVARGRKPL